MKKNKCKQQCAYKDISTFLVPARHVLRNLPNPGDIIKFRYAKSSWRTERMLVAYVCNGLVYGTTFDHGRICFQINYIHSDRMPPPVIIGHIPSNYSDIAYVCIKNPHPVYTQGLKPGMLIEVRFPSTSSVLFAAPLTIRGIESDYVYCRSKQPRGPTIYPYYLPNGIYRITTDCIWEIDAKWFRRWKQTENAKRIRLTREREINTNQEYKKKKEAIIAQKAHAIQAKRERDVKRRQEMNSFQALTNLIPANNGFQVRNIPYGEMLVASSDGVIIGRANCLHEKEDDKGTIARSESSEEDTWKSFGVAHPETDGRFGGINGIDFAD